MCTLILYVNAVQVDENENNRRTTRWRVQVMRRQKRGEEEKESITFIKTKTYRYEQFVSYLQERYNIKTNNETYKRAEEEEGSISIDHPRQSQQVRHLPQPIPTHRSTLFPRGVPRLAAHRESIGQDGQDRAYSLLD